MQWHWNCFGHLSGITIEGRGFETQPRRAKFSACTRSGNYEIFTREHFLECFAWHIYYYIYIVSCHVNNAALFLNNSQYLYNSMVSSAI